ncbi:MAG TPA: UbiA family prenyltransferase [Beutenbergiaceae bacterium]|nr:UbiA family prenyltransferase [Beutenbergiaceae bacterium]
MPSFTALVRASHPAPTVVVSALAALLAVGAGHRGATVLLISAAVLTGQLTIGWSNDLIDAPRDRAVGRTDKPLATGVLQTRTVQVALVVAGVVCTGLSVLMGWWAALAHLVLVGCGWLYNATVKATVWSWSPYAVAFGALPTIPWLALQPPVLPPWWLVAAGGLLGVGAHVVNVLPDLADDAVTGVRGVPHRLGARGSGLVGVGAFLAGTAVAVLGPGLPVPGWGWAVLGAAALLAIGSLGRPGRLPFYSAMVIALLNVIAILGRIG